MKKLRFALIMAVILTITNTTKADELTKNELNRINNQVEEMTVVMSLTKDQADKLHTLKTVLAKKNNEAKEKYGVDSEEWKVAKKTNLRNYSVALRRVCSDDQIELWKEHNKNISKTS